MVATVLRGASTSGPREEQPLPRTCLPKSTTCRSVLRLQPVLISCCLLRESLLSYPKSAAVLGRCRFQRKQERSGSQHCLSIHKSFSPRSAQDTRLPTTGRTSKCSRKAIRPTTSIYTARHDQAHKRVPKGQRSGRRHARGRRLLWRELPHGPAE